MEHSGSATDVQPGTCGLKVWTVWENGELLRKYALREVRATLDAMD